MIDGPATTETGSLFGDVPVYPELEESTELADSTEHAFMARATADGTKWVSKKVCRSGIEFVHAEACCHFLAKRLSIPVPTAAIYRGDDGVGWLSGFVELAHPWRPEFLESLVTPRDMARIIAFDALVLVPDRHEDNLLCTDTPDGRTSVTAIDFGRALLSRPELGSFEGRPPVLSSSHLRCFPAHEFEEEALSLCDDVERLSDDEIRQVLNKAATAVGVPPSGTIVDQVLRRRDAARVIVRAHVQAVGALR